MPTGSFVGFGGGGFVGVDVYLDWLARESSSTTNHSSRQIPSSQIRHLLGSQPVYVDTVHWQADDVGGVLISSCIVVLPLRSAWKISGGMQFVHAALQDSRQSRMLRMVALLVM